MEKSIIHSLTTKIISIILSIIVMAVQINVIKTAMELERTPPVYLLQTYTVILAVAVISYLVYFSISQGVDVYRIIEEYKKYSNWHARTKAYKESNINYENTLAAQIEKEKLALKALDQIAKPMKEPNPIDNTIEEFKTWSAHADRLGNPYFIREKGEGGTQIITGKAVEQIKKKGQESVDMSSPVEMVTEETVNPIDLKFDPLEGKAKEVLTNLKKKRNVQK